MSEETKEKDQIIENIHVSFTDEAIQYKSDDDESTIEYGTTWISWLQVASVVLINSACAFMWLSAASSPIAVSEWLNVSFTSLNWLSNSSAVINTIFSLITGWSYERFGIKKNLIFAGVVNLVGCWVRFAATAVPENRRYTLMLVGQIIGSVGGPFVYNISAKLASLWFAPEHRAVANLLSALSLGFTLAPIIIPPLSPSAIQVPWMLKVIAIIATCCTIPSFFLPSEPKKLAAPSADQKRMGIFEGIQSLSKNVTFWWIAILWSVNTGMTYSIATLIIEAISPFGYTDQQSGYCAAAVYIAGTVGGVFSGYWAGKGGHHVMLIKIFTPLMVFTYVMFNFNIIPNAFNVILLTCILNGFFTYAIFPLHVELACEISYPVPEAFVSSFLYSLGTASMLIFCVIIDALRAGPEADPPNNMKKSMIFAAILSAVGSLPAIWLKGNLKRLAYDLERQKH